MSRLPATALALLLVLPALPAAAQATDPAPAPAETPVPAPQATADKIRCKTQTVTGSRFPQKICRTEAQWAASEEGARTFMRDIDARGSKSPFGEGNGGGTSRGF